MVILNLIKVKLGGFCIFGGWFELKRDFFTNIGRKQGTSALGVLSQNLEYN